MRCGSICFNGLYCTSQNIGANLRPTRLALPASRSPAPLWPMGNPPELYHKILNLPKDTSPSEIRAAYKNLVRKWHSDKHPPKPEAEARFKAITEAYEVSMFCTGGGVRALIAELREMSRDVVPVSALAQALLDHQQENTAVFGVCNDGRAAERPPLFADAGGGVAPRMERTRSDDFHARRAPGTPTREFKKVYSSGNSGGRCAFAEFSSSIMRKASPLERKLECTLEELCRGCKKEVKFSRDVVTKNGWVLCSLPHSLFLTRLQLTTHQREGPPYLKSDEQSVVFSYSI
jgi:DnaJ homolog subfamily B member 13